MRPLAASTALNSALDALSAAMHDAATGCGVLSVRIGDSLAFQRMKPHSVDVLAGIVHQRLVAGVRRGDSVHRIGVGEWVLVLPQLQSASVLELAVLKLQGRFEDCAFAIDGHEIRPRLQFGTAMWPDDGADPLHLLQSARIAQFHQMQAPQAGTRYDPAMELPGLSDEEIDQAVRQALVAGHSFRLFMQPKIRLADGRCDSAECLLRFPIDEGTWISPLDALAAVDRIGLRARFTRWLFMTAVDTLCALADNGIDIQLSLNLAASDLLDRELAEMLSLALRTRQVRPESIRLEITETGMVENNAGVRAVLLDLRSRGVSLSVDDFGTGFSTMSYLRDLPVQEVKIDQSFVRNAGHSTHDREIITAIVQLAHRLEISVTAEGVEDQATEALITRLGCDHAQGYLYAPALARNAFIDWYRARHPDGDQPARSIVAR